MFTLGVYFKKDLYDIKGTFDRVFKKEERFKYETRYDEITGKPFQRKVATGEPLYYYEGNKESLATLLLLLERNSGSKRVYNGKYEDKRIVDPSIILFQVGYIGEVDTCSIQELEEIKKKHMNAFNFFNSLGLEPTFGIVALERADSY